jgi:hypothetical protein
MKTAIAILAAGLMSFGMVGNAAAKGYHLIPESTTFTASGSTSATKSGVTLKCKAKFTGHIDANGVGSVDSGSFTGELGCTAVSLSNLPWAATALNAKRAKLANVAFTSPIGNCGPGDIQITVADGALKFKNQPLSGSCVISGKIKTNPAVSIVPN